MTEECGGVVGWVFFSVVAVVVAVFPQNFLLKEMLKVQYIQKECVCVAEPIFLKVLPGISLNM